MTITSITEQYIRTHASINNCIQKGVINYSALARLIIKEKKLKATEEAVLIAARRYKDRFPEKPNNEIFDLYRDSSIEIKNNILSYTIEKNTLPESLVSLEQKIKKENGIFFAIEGTKSITIIIQSPYKNQLEKRFRRSILNSKEDQVLITITSIGIGKVPGAVAHIAGVFAEAGVNIEEFMSCHDDTLIVINRNDMGKAMGLLEF